MGCVSVVRSITLDATQNADSKGLNKEKTDYLACWDNKGMAMGCNHNGFTITK